MRGRTALLAAPLVGGMLVARPASAASITLNPSTDCGCFESSGQTWCHCGFSGTVNAQTKPDHVDCYVTIGGTASYAGSDYSLGGHASAWTYNACGASVTEPKGSGGNLQREDIAIQGVTAIAWGYGSWNP